MKQLAARTPVSKGWLWTGRLGILLGSAFLSGQALAVDFSSSSGDWSGSWDTTVSLGASWRVQSPDRDIIATSAGGNSRGPNDDDGTQNYSTGLVSSVIKATSEIELNYKDNLGAFVRASGFYDFENENNARERTPLTEGALNRVGSRTDLLDAYVWGRFDLGRMPAEIRVGQQVVSWGESTFIPGGINVINHFDINAIRLPGGELREAFLPQDLVWLSLGTSDNTSFEAFYQYDWDDTEPDASGSYFSTNDFVPDGSVPVVLGFGAFSDQGTSFDPDFLKVPRGTTIEPDDDGQYGAAFRWYLPNFGQGTELGFYYVNYHSRLPLINALTGTQVGIGNGAGAATAVGGAALGIGAGLSPAAAIAAASQQAVATAAALGGNYTLQEATVAATVGANAALTGGDVVGLAGAFANDAYAETARYFTAFPEDLEMIGVSYNTQIGTTGVALQGELSYHMDAPTQVDDLEVLFAALAPLESTIGAGALAAFGQLGGFGTSELVPGIEFQDKYQFQTTATKVFGYIPWLGAGQGVLLFEVAAIYFPDMPDKQLGGPNGFGLRLNGPGTPISGNANLAGFHFGEVEPQSRFASSTSWGYRLVGRLDYFGLVGPWNVSPRFAFQHDVKGTTPGPGGAFVEDRKAVSIGVNALYQSTWQVDLSYTTFFDASRYNLINDRDFIGANIKVSF